MMRQRIMALAGVFQGTELAGSLANTGQADNAALNATLGSLYVFDSGSVEDVFGGLQGLRMGLESLVNNFSGERDAGVLQAVVKLLQLGKQLRHNDDMSNVLRDSLEALAVHRQDESLDADEHWRRLGALYEITISTLLPRVVIRGNPVFLQQGHYVSGIRAALLGAVRSALLWHQLGGSRLQIILRGRKVLGLARELLTEAEARAEHPS